MRLGGWDLVVARDTHGVERVGDVLRLLEHPTERIGSLQPFPHRGDREVLRPDGPRLHLFPRERHRDRGPWFGPRGVDGGDVGPDPIHVVIYEHLAGALPDLP